MDGCGVCRSSYLGGRRATGGRWGLGRNRNIASGPAGSTAPGAASAAAIATALVCAAVPATAVAAAARAVAGRPVDRVGADDDAPAVAVLTVLREDLDQTSAHALAGHLDQTQRSHLCNLVLGPVASQAFQQSTHDQVAVALQHHVDEVDNDDAADVTQP